MFQIGKLKNQTVHKSEESLIGKAREGLSRPTDKGAAVLTHRAKSGANFTFPRPGRHMHEEFTDYPTFAVKDKNGHRFPEQDDLTI